MRLPEKSSASSAATKIKTGAELLRALEERSRRPLPSAPPLDALEGGGLKRGSLIELCGRRSSGRFALALSALAAVTRAGEAAALVDPGDHLDVHGAEAAGVALERLLWIRPPSLRQALVCAQACLGAGFALVVLDLGERKWEKAPEGCWRRLALDAEASNSVVLLISRAPTAGPAAESLIEAGAARAVWDKNGPPLLTGLQAQLTLRRRRGRGAGGQVPLSLPLGD